MCSWCYIGSRYDWCPSEVVIVACVNKQESIAVAPLKYWFIHLVVNGVDELSACFCSATLTSFNLLGPGWQPEMCTVHREVCASVCLPLCLAGFTSEDRRGGDPDWRTWADERCFLRTPPPHFPVSLGLSGAACRAAMHALPPSQRWSSVCYAHSCARS